MPKVSFYKTAAGNDVVLEFIRAQPLDDRRVIGRDLKVLEIGYPVGMPLCRHIEGDLWEVRSSLPSKREARLIYFYDGKRQMIVVVSGFVKTTRSTPKREINLAQRRRKECG
jgi:phage-related protein